MRGRIPQSIVGLTNLTHLELDYNDIWGDFPPEIFSLPSIHTVILSSTAVNVRLPPLLSASLVTMSVSLRHYVVKLAHQSNFFRQES